MIKNGWYCCPICGWDKVQRIERHSTVVDTPIYCRKCKNTLHPHIENGKEYDAEDVLIRAAMGLPQK